MRAIHLFKLPVCLFLQLLGLMLCAHQVNAQISEEPIQLLARYDKIGILADLDCTGPQFGCLGRLKALDLNSLDPLPVLSGSLCPMPLYEGLLGGYATAPNYRIQGIQKGPLLYSWCTGSAAFQVWHISTRKKIREIPIQAERPWFEPFYLYHSQTHWASDGKWAVLREPRDRLVLADQAGNILAKTPLPSTIRTAQKNENYAWTSFGRSRSQAYPPIWETWAQIWAYPSLKPLAQWKMPDHNGKIWLFQKFGLRFQSCVRPENETDNADWFCAKKLKPHTLEVDWIEPLTGKTIKKMIINQIQTYGFLNRGWWVLSQNKLKVFGQTPSDRPIETPSQMGLDCKKKGYNKQIDIFCARQVPVNAKKTEFQIENTHALGVYDLETGRQQTVISTGENEPWFHVYQGHLLRFNPDPMKPRFSWLNLDTLVETEFNGPDLPIQAIAIENNLLITADSSALRFWNLDSRKELFKRPFQACKPEQIEITAQEIVYLCSRQEVGGRDSEGTYRRARRHVLRSTLKKDSQDWDKSFQTEWMEIKTP